MVDNLKHIWYGKDRDNHAIPYFAGKEDIMPQSMRRGVLFMDVHGVLLGAEDSNNSGVPITGHHVHQKWVDVVRTALDEAGANSLQIKENILDSRALWKLRMHIELTTHRTTKGKAVKEKKFHERVNLRLLQEVAPSFMRSLSKKARKQIAHRVKELRRDTSRYGYILEQEMRGLIHELVKNDQWWVLYLTTAGDHGRTAKLLQAQNAPICSFFTTESIGAPKSHPDYWIRIAAKAKSSPSGCVVVEDNLIMGINAVKAGMSVIFVDRDCGIEDFIRNKLNSRVAGVNLPRVGGSLPSNGAQFAVCVKSIAGVKLCLQRIKTRDSKGIEALSVKG